MVNKINLMTGQSICVIPDKCSVSPGQEKGSDGQLITSHMSISLNLTNFYSHFVVFDIC